MRIDLASGVHSVALHIQKMGLLRLWRHRWPQVRQRTHLYYKTDVTLQGGRCPADQPSNVTAVGRPHVSTPEAFSKAATPIYIFHYFKDRSISSSISARPARGAFIKRSD
ncbi:MAG: hypothetical protein E7103_05250 [Prevotella sp.]|nr:hypothetical protein [Prevotella sp.]